MFGLDFIWKKVIEDLSIGIENQQDDSFILILNQFRLAEIDEKSAALVTNESTYKIILSNYVNEIEESFKRVLDKDIRVSISTELEFAQRKDIEDTIEKELYDNVSPEFTFDNFIVGKCNFEAQAAALAVASKPGRREYNPLVIYGNSGLGKTHLLCAIGNYIKKHDRDSKILYISAITFVNEVIKAIKENRIDEYKSQLNSLDVLLVDDIQNLSNKPKTNEVFFDTYNELFNNHKQIVLTSDRPPIEIKDIEDRLKTRFSQGLSVTIQSLENDTAYRIIEQKIKINNLDKSYDIQPEVISYIASNFSTDVRSLEGALNRLIFYAINMSSSDTISLDLALEAFKDQQNTFTTHGHSASDMKVIIKIVSNYYGLTEKQLISKNRTKNIATARHIAMYLCRKYLDESYGKIGDMFGGRDHTTVLSACEKIENALKTDTAYQKAVSDIEAQLK